MAWISLPCCHCESSTWHWTTLALFFEFNRLDESLSRVFENDQLVSDDAVDNLLLFMFRNVMYVSSFMKLSLAAAITFRSVKNLVYVYLVITARVLVGGSKWPMKVHLDFGCNRMVPTVAHLCNRVVLMASIALDKMQVRPNFPVDLLPGNTVRLSNVSYEFLKIPRLIDHMLGSHLTVGIDEGSTLPAAQNFPLLLCEELVAVGTLVEVIFVFLKEQFKFLHKQSADNFILALLKNI